MKNYFLLLKVVLSNNFRNTKFHYLNDNTKTSKKTYLKVINVLLISLGFLVMLGWFGLTVHVISLLCAVEGISVELLSILFTGTQLMIIFFGIQSVLSNTFFSKDNEFLAQLPVKPKLIFAVKMSVIYINELALSTIMLLPILIAFISGSIIGNFYIPIYFYFLIPVALLLAPIIPLMFVTILAFPFVKIVSYFKNKSAVTLVASILVFVIFMASYMLIVPNIDKLFSIEGQATIITPQIRNVIIGFGNFMFFNKSIAMVMLGKKVLINLLIVVSTLVLCVGVALFLSSVLYKKAISQIGEETKGKVNNKVAINNESKSKMLFKREFKTLFRDQSFAFNSILGSVLTPLIIALMFFVGFNKADAIAGQVVDSFSQDFQTMGFVLFYSIFMMCGLNYTATISFTREGKTFYILRYLPIDINDIIKAKVNLAHTVSAVGLVLIALVSTFIVKIKLYNLLPMIISIAIFQFAFNNLGVYRDLKKPNVTWTSAYEAIKKNFYPMVPMFYAMGIGIVFMIGAQFFPLIKLSKWLIVLLYWLIVLVVGIALAVFVKKLTKKNAKTFFDRINVD